MNPPADRRGAAEFLGPHLLGRKPMPRDDRDFKLAEFVSAHRRLVTDGALSPDMTVQDLIDMGELTSWSGILAFWRWLKTLLEHPRPTPAPPPADADVRWQIGPISDQGQTGHCVGFTGLDWGNCLPIDDQWPNEEGHTLYYECKVIDGEPQAEDGSDSRSLCKALQQRGRVGAYAFASDVATIRAYVREHGPVGIGIPWDNSMFNPDGDGYVSPDGNEDGGHEVMISAHLPGGKGATTKPSFEIPNHWGASWADNGVCYMTEDDLQRLLDRGGDSWAGLENSLT